MIDKNKKKNEILKYLSEIFEIKVKLTDKINRLPNFDSIIILQIINLAKTNYKKNIDPQKISKCKIVSEITDIII